MNKLYSLIMAVIVISIIIVVAWLRYDYIVKDRDQYKTKFENAAANLAIEKANRDTEKQASIEAAARSNKIQSEKEAIENEAKNMRSCIDNNSCGVRVELKYKVCPSLPTTATSGSMANDDQPYGGDFQRWINDTRESIKLDALKIKGLQEDLKIRSSPDYCTPKIPK